MSLQEQHTILVAYLRAKMEAADWHGVRDAAVDIELLEVRMKARTAMDTQAAERKGL